jgi:hypothetical protein
VNAGRFVERLTWPNSCGFPAEIFQELPLREDRVRASLSSDRSKHRITWLVRILEWPFEPVTSPATFFITERKRIYRARRSFCGRLLWIDRRH